MIIEQISGNDRNKLQLSLNKFLSSYQKRGINFIITSESEYVGVITIIVSGKMGSVQKSVIVIYNHLSGEWEAYSEGVVCKMLSLSEIGIFVKSKINSATVLVRKI